MHTVDYDPVDTLLRAGVSHLRFRELSEARQCFEEVLRRNPDHAEALAGLDAVERHETGSPLIIGRSPSVESKTFDLMREERYEEALDSLYRARESTPDDPTIARSIRIIEVHLERRFREAIDLDAVPTILHTPEEGDAAVVARWIDGTRTFGELLDVCSLDWFRALRALHGLLTHGRIVVALDETRHQLPGPKRNV